MYCKLNEDANGVITQTNYSVVSAGSSFMFHSSPSIIAIGSGARICWLGYNDEVPPDASVVFKDPAYSRFWSFGSNASRPNINKSNDNTYYALAWSQNNSTVKFADNNLRNIYEIIDIQGRDVQLSNGNGKSKRKGIKFQGEILPEEYALEQNYPNPFNPTTKIRFSIPRSTEYYSGRQNVTLKVYDIIGNEVATLVNEPKEPGYYEVEFSIGSFGDASGLASGVYIYRLTAGNFVASRKMILIK